MSSHFELNNTESGSKRAKILIASGALVLISVIAIAFLSSRKSASTGILVVAQNEDPEIKPVDALVPSGIPEGYRKVIIDVDAVGISLEGSISSPRVDLVWTSNIPGKNDATVIVENARVLSARRADSKHIHAEMVNPYTVTLLVTAADEQVTKFSATKGSISLTLHGDSATRTDRAPIRIITLTDPLPHPNPEDKPVQRAAEDTVKMRGADGQMRKYVVRNGKMGQVSDQLDAVVSGAGEQ